MLHCKWCYWPVHGKVLSSAIFHFIYSSSALLCFALVLKCVFRDFLNWLVTRKIFLCLLIYTTPWLSCYPLLFGMQPKELLVAIVQVMINVSAFRNGGREPVIVRDIKGISQGYACSLTEKYLLFSLLL